MLPCYNKARKGGVDMDSLNRVLDELVEQGLVGHIAVRVGLGDKVIYDAFRGGVDTETLFDMASVTKVIATTTLALIALDKGLLSLDDLVDRFYPNDKQITIKNLLTHTMGIGYRLLTQDGNSQENIAEKILQMPSDVAVGSEVLYSCPGYILLGKIVERAFNKPLNECFEELVAKPLGLSYTSFLPANRQNAVNANLDEQERGIVNDYNAKFLGGVAGNAGLFSNIIDVTRYISALQRKGAPLFSEKTFSMAAQNYTAGMSQARGLGFLYVDARYKQAYGLFEDGAIGHCGHTGQSIFLDYRTGLYVIILSDATVSTIKKYGEEHYDEVIDMRARIHNAIKADMAK